MKTLEQIRSEGFEALLKALGPVDTIRFFQQFSTGHGNYSKNRHQWLDNISFEELSNLKSKEKE